MATLKRKTQKMRNRFTILSVVFLNLIAKNSFGDQYSLSLDKVDSSRFFKYATLQILDKTTAKTTILKIKVKEKTAFGRMTIRIDKCWQAPLDQKPDSKILLEILENDRDKQENRIFYGWMIASSPSISGLEHPVYDVIALNCKNE